MHRIESSLEHCPSAGLAQVLRTASQAALEAGALIRQLHGQPHRIRHKGEIDLVTEADPASEKIIIDLLKRDFPDSSVLAEESCGDYRHVPQGPLWIIDPLDGTTNFAHGFPYFGVSIGYAEKGRVLAGVIYCPMQDELFLACRGGGAWLNGMPVRVSRAANLKESLLATGFPYSISENLDRVVDSLAAVLPRIRDLRRGGAAALDLAYLACGRLDGFWEMELKPWDVAAGQILVEEAGGELSDFSGRAFSPFRPELVASNGKVHGEMLELLTSPLSGAGKN